MVRSLSAFEKVVYTLENCFACAVMARLSAKTKFLVPAWIGCSLVYMLKSVGARVRWPHRVTKNQL